MWFLHFIESFTKISVLFTFQATTKTYSSISNQGGQMFKWISCVFFVHIVSVSTHCNCIRYLMMKKIIWANKVCQWRKKSAKSVSMKQHCYIFDVVCAFHFVLFQCMRSLEAYNSFSWFIWLFGGKWHQKKWKTAGTWQAEEMNK